MCFFVHPSELGFFKFPQIKQGVLRNQKSTFSKSRGVRTFFRTA